MSWIMRSLSSDIVRYPFLKAKELQPQRQEIQAYHTPNPRRSKPRKTHATPTNRSPLPRRSRFVQQAEFTIRGGPILLLPPHAKHGHHGDDPLPMYVVYVSEVSPPPRGEKPIDWMLLTNEPVHNSEDAWRVVGWYERRWVIEEYHKAMKTGCRIEDLQFTAVERLQPANALLLAVALTLLNLRDASRLPDATTRQATELFSADYVDVLSIWRYGKLRGDWTVHDFSPPQQNSWVNSGSGRSPRL